MRSGEPQTPSPDGTLLFSVFTEISIIEHLARNRLERALPDGLRMSHFGVLNHMVRLGDGQTPAELARAFQVVKGAMTNTLQRLEARGLISILPDEKDGRSKRVKLTPKGQQAREAAVVIALGIFDELADAQLSARLKEAAPALRDLRAALDDCG